MGLSIVCLVFALDMLSDIKMISEKNYSNIKNKCKKVAFNIWCVMMKLTI